MGTEALGDRRPIASRKLRVWQVTSEGLARAGVTANAISVMGMCAGILGGVALVMTGMVGNDMGVRALFLGSAGLIQLRLLANMLDGMVAVESGKVSKVGELYNEIPDRISDTVILAGAGYAMGGDPALGWGAAVVALFVTYIRAVGKTVGVPGLFHGPMSKSHRMFTLTMTCLYVGIAPGSWQPMWQLGYPQYPVGIMALALMLIVVGGMVTAYRRLVRIVRALKERG